MIATLVRDVIIYHLASFLSDKDMLSGLRVALRYADFSGLMLKSVYSEYRYLETRRRQKCYMFIKLCYTYMSRISLQSIPIECTHLTIQLSGMQRNPIKLNLPYHVTHLCVPEMRTCHFLYPSTVTSIQVGSGTLNYRLPDHVVEFIAPEHDSYTSGLLNNVKVCRYTTLWIDDERQYRDTIEELHYRRALMPELGFKNVDVTLLPALIEWTKMPKALKRMTVGGIEVPLPVRQ